MEDPQPPQSNRGFSNPLSDINGEDHNVNKDLKNGKSSLHFDAIEVSLVEDEVADPDVILVNATDFFVEHNSNYEVSWDEASYKINEVGDDPSKPPIPGWNIAYVRFRLRRLIGSFYFRIFTMVLIIVDIAIVIADIASSDVQDFSNLQLADLIITCYFVVEILLRIVALTQAVFFSSWYNVVDFTVVFSTFIIVMAAAVPKNAWAESLTLLTILRTVRIFRLIRLYTEKKQMESAARQLISQNKRRYQQDGFDLDLTYVTARVIATSFPSKGLLALYRNPIEKVAAFLDAKHEGKYKLYNLCSERTYETKLFHHRVERFLIDDHNVPSCEEMIRFAKSVKDWLQEDPDNVIVVHCKGGKGRTGTMICVWLVESGVFTKAAQSLAYFGERRTDTNVGKKFQGVETPSQSRYVGYYEIIKNSLDGRLPPTRRLTLTKISIKGLRYVGRGDGSDFWFNVDKGRGNQVFSAHFGFRRNCSTSYDSLADLFVAELTNSPPLEGDIRVLFQTSSPVVPKGYESCPFFFWFHTFFVDQESLSLSLDREHLDNPHKAKTWHCFREDFQIKLEFVESQS